MFNSPRGPKGARGVHPIEGLTGQAAKPSTKKPSTTRKEAEADGVVPPPRDALQKGTEWSGEYTRRAIGEPVENGDAYLIITARQGDQFEGTLTKSNNEMKIGGLIRGSRVTWTLPDRDHQYQGTIDGEQMSLSHSGTVLTNGQPVSGTLSLRLKK